MQPKFNKLVYNALIEKDKGMLLYMGGFGFPEVLLPVFFGCLPFILAIAALIDILRSEFRESNTKLIWVIIVIFVPVLGSILYFTLGGSHKVKRPGPF
jgi:hypothetical protein